MGEQAFGAAQPQPIETAENALNFSGGAAFLKKSSWVAPWNEMFFYPPSHYPRGATLSTYSALSQRAAGKQKVTGLQLGLTWSGG